MEGLLYKYSEQPSKPSSSSSHFSAGVSRSESVDAKMHAPDSTKNFTMAKLLQLAAQCNGVQPSESWAFTSQPYSTRNLCNPGGKGGSVCVCVCTLAGRQASQGWRREFVSLYII